MGAFGIVIAGMTVLTAKNLVFTPIYSSIITKQPLTAYYKGILMPAAGAAFVVLTGAILQRMFPVESWFGLFSLSAVVSAIYCIMIFSVVLEEGERRKVKSIMLQMFNVHRKEV